MVRFRDLNGCEVPGLAYSLEVADGGLVLDVENVTCGHRACCGVLTAVDFGRVSLAVDARCKEKYVEEGCTPRKCSSECDTLELGERDETSSDEGDAMNRFFVEHLRGAHAGQHLTRFASLPGIPLS